MTQSFGKELRNSFIAGLLVVVPLAASIVIVIGAFTFLTDFFLPPSLQDKLLTPLYRIIALVGFIAFTTALGWVMRWVIGQRLVAASQAVIGRVPLLNKTYGFMKDLSETFLGEKGSIFQRVVVVEYPRPGIYTIAFATGETGGEVDGKTSHRLVSVFLPTPPNPTTGYLALFPRERVVELQMSVADAMKMSFSGGAVVPPYPPPATARVEGAG